MINGKVFDQVGSTNSELKKLILEGCGLPFYVCAKGQTSGRGKGDRKWVSPEGSLYLSVGFSVSEVEPSLTKLPLFVGSLMIRVLGNKYGLQGLKLKWPNDVYCNGKKIAGILCESVIRGKSTFVVCGIGVNLIGEAPIEGSTTVHMETKVDFLEPLDLAEQILEGFEIQLLRGELFDFTISSEDQFFRSGDLLEIESNGIIEIVSYQGLGELGELLVLGAKQDTKAIYSADSVRLKSRMNN